MSLLWGLQNADESEMLLQHTGFVLAYATFVSGWVQGRMNLCLRPSPCIAFAAFKLAWNALAVVRIIVPQEDFVSQELAGAIDVVLFQLMYAVLLKDAYAYLLLSWGEQSEKCRLSRTHIAGLMTLQVLLSCAVCGVMALGSTHLCRLLPLILALEAACWCLVYLATFSPSPPLMDEGEATVITTGRNSMRTFRVVYGTAVIFMWLQRHFWRIPLFSGQQQQSHGLILCGRRDDAAQEVLFFAALLYSASNNAPTIMSYQKLNTPNKRCQIDVDVV